MFEKITSENVIMYAIKNYNNPQCEGELEFYDDLKRFKYIKRLFKKYQETGELRERLLLNHFIVLNNVFGPDAAITLLLFKIEKEHWGIMKSFLIYLNILEKHELSNIQTDEYALDVLRKI
tara:strand:- start:168 stop:530 length:363 start_codon:yes stop_codon:yes gene_type:complete